MSAPGSLVLSNSFARVEAARLAWRCDPAQLDFDSTDELEDLGEVLGQTRALEAVEFGVGMRRNGYHLFVQGPPGIGKRTIVRQLLERRAGGETTPPDWCYVNNFDDPQKPLALRLPAGRGAQLKQQMETLLDDLRAAIPAALQTDEHRARLQEIEHRFEAEHLKAFEELAQKAEARGIKLLRTPGGFALAPMRNGTVVGPEEFTKLSDDEKREVEEAVGTLQQELQAIIEQVPQRRKEASDKIKELSREVTRFAIGHLMERVKQGFTDLGEVIAYLNAVERDVVDNAGQFLTAETESPGVSGMPQPQPSLEAYQVNLLVDNGGARGAPVVFEDHPTYQNLLGRVEYMSEMGTLSTDFTLIKPGALHRASGGYLVVEAFRMLAQPYAWEGLKRALYARELRIESLGQTLGLLSTVSLEPRPIPLDVKVVLVGERLLFYLLYQYDPDFAELFKVAADFDDRVDRSPENCRLYARLVATLARRETLRPFDRGGVARVLEHGARLADDAEKLSTHLRTLVDLLREADYWAAQDHAALVGQAHVERAITQQVRRADRLRQRLQEEIRRGTLLIDTEGEKVGQVNGLSVIDLGNFAFGHPARITATARIGKGEVIDVEREVELGGAIHSKGVLILSSFLAARYARNQPLSLAASLVFEQSYGRVEGDSASVGELCALLSALAEVPIKQSLAVTGSVNQRGDVQAIGGVNEKIEGFFDLCLARGLTGEQGVVIPSANLKHLMLRHDVVEAAAAGRFAIYAVDTIDDAITLLTGVPAGKADDDGVYPLDSVNQRVLARLTDLFQLRLKATELAKAGASHA